MLINAGRVYVRAYSAELVWRHSPFHRRKCHLQKLKKKALLAANRITTSTHLYCICRNLARHRYI